VHADDISVRTRSVHRGDQAAGNDKEVTGPVSLTNQNFAWGSRPFLAVLGHKVHLSVGKPRKCMIFVGCFG
jgi:hypothetical protein